MRVTHKISDPTSNNHTQIMIHTTWMSECLSNKQYQAVLINKKLSGIKSVSSRENRKSTEPLAQHHKY